MTGPRFGYDIDQVLTVDRASALVTTASPVEVGMQTSAVSETVEGTPTPVASQDGISRITVGSSGIQGRGVRVTVSPTTAPDQFSIQSMTLHATAYTANPDEDG